MTSPEGVVSSNQEGSSGWRKLHRPRNCLMLEMQNYPIGRDKDKGEGCSGEWEQHRPMKSTLSENREAETKQTVTDMKRVYLELYVEPCTNN